MEDSRTLQSYIDKKLNEYLIDREKNFFVPDALSDFSCFPSLMFFDPIGTHNERLKCPIHSEVYLIHSHKWASSMTKTASHRPRLLYDNSRNVLLISSLYYCPECGKMPYLACNELLTLQLSDHVSVNFKVRHRSGFTLSCLQRIINATIAGTVYFIGK